MNSKITLLFLLLFMSGVQVLGASQKVLMPIPDLSKKISEKDKVNAERSLFKATAAFTLDRTDSAFIYVHNSLKMNPNSAGAYFQWYRIEEQYRRLDGAIYAAHWAYMLDSTNISYVTELASVAMEAQQFEKSKKAYVQMGVIQPNNPKALRGQLECEVSQNQYDKSLDIIHKIKQRGEYDDAIMRIHCGLLLLKDPASAEKEAVEYYEETGSMAPLLFLGQLYLGVDLQKTNYWLMKAELINPDDFSLLLTRLRYHLASKNSELAFLKLNELLLNEQLTPEGRLLLYEMIIDNNQLHSGNINIIDSLFQNEKLLANTSRFQLLYGVWLLSYSAVAKPEIRVINMLNKIGQDGERFSIMKNRFLSHTAGLDEISVLHMYLLLSQYLIGKGRVKELDVFTKQAWELSPYNNRAAYYRGIVLFYSNSPKKSIPVFKKAIELGPTDTFTVVSSHRHIAEISIGLKDIKQAIANYEKAISYNFFNPVLYNNYAYFLAERNENLALAHRLISVVIERGSENTNYLDTYAYILHKLGKYEQAIEQFKIIFSLSEKQPPVVYEHYGDTLYKVGDLENAKIYWNKAIRSGAKFKLSEKEL